MTNSPIDLDALRSNLQRVRDAIASLTAAGEDEQMLQPLRQRESQLRQQIDTGGGAAVGGSVFTGGGPFIGRDYQRVEVASGAFFVSGDIHGLTVVNQAGQQQRLAPDQAQPDKLLEVYYRWLAEECRRLPLGVIDAKFVRTNVDETVPLPDVYVDLDVVPSTPQEEETKRGWALRLARAGTDAGGRIPALDALAEQTRAVLIGDAGSGKTTFVNYLTYLLAQPGSLAAGALPEALRGRLALRLVLREAAADHVPADSEQGDADMLWRAVEADMARPLGQQAAAILLPYVQQRLWSEGGVVLLDGLDEVPAVNRRRQTLLQAVASLAATLPDTAGRILVTARPYAYADPQWRLAGFVTLALAPFDEGQQARFVQRWHQAARLAMGWSEVTALLKGQDLQEALGERPYLADLATRPLLLTLMATVHSSRGSLPEDRADLYEQTVDLLLDRWQKERIVKRASGEVVVEPGIRQVLDVGQEAVRVALQRLAYAAHDAQRQEAEGREAEANIPEGQVLVAFKPVLGKVHPNELLAYLDQRAGLLIPREPGIYAFPHRSIQEYLAACHLSGQLDYKARVRRLIEEDMAWWREVLLLSILRRDIGSAVHFMEELLPRWRPKQPPGSTDWRMVGLLGEAAVELRLVEWIKKGEDYSGLLADIRDWLERLVDGGHLTAAERLAAGNALGKLGDTRPGVGLVEGVEPPLPDIAWVEIPAGPFTMGSSDQDDAAYDDERPAHPLRLPLYFVARYPVTNAQFRPFVEGDGYSNPAYWTQEGWAWRNGADPDLSPYDDLPEETRKDIAEWLAERTPDKRSQPWWWDDARWGAANRPVVGVTWYEALAYCRWLDARLRAAGGVLQVENKEVAIPSGYRVHLPSEAEWEKAARGADGRLWPWSGGWQEGRANSKEAGLEQTSPVGIFPDGRSAHGLLDMAGNVWQWTRSRWGERAYTPEFGYPYDPDDGREQLDGSDLRVLRGGSYWEEQKFARCACRNWDIPVNFRGNFGFRVVVSLANAGF